MTVIRRRALAALTALGLAATVGPALADYPEQPIKIIVPTDPGGAMDGLARLFQRAFEEMDVFPQNVAIVNMAGAGGTIGTRAIKDAAPDGYTIGFWHDGLVTSKAMGVAEFDHEAFEIIGTTGFAQAGLAVSKEGRFESFQEMIDTAKAEPGTVTVATNIGLPVHFVPMMVGEAAGAEFRFVQAGGGAKRLQSVLGGHTDFALFSTQELVQFDPAGLKPVVLLAEERSPQLPDVPTAREHGIDVVAASARIWLAPKGTPEDRLALIRDAFREAMQREDVKQQMIDFGLEPVFVEPEVVVDELDATMAATMPLVEKARAIQQ
jgi:putative tricarboxylic transport membrane protein